MCAAMIFILCRWPKECEINTLHLFPTSWLHVRIFTVYVYGAWLSLHLLAFMSIRRGGFLLIKLLTAFIQITSEAIDGRILNGVQGTR